MRAVFAFAAVVGWTAVASADTARAEFQVERGSPHAEVPFVIDLVIEGFDESPAPDQPKLELATATVTPLGTTPRVSRSLQIVNGHRVDSSSVTWVMRWRVLAHSAGPLRVPSVIVRQGGATATAAAGEVVVESVPTSDDMKLALVLPNRAVFVGETVAVKLVWLFVPQPEDQTFEVPMFGLDAFTISGPPVPANSRKALTIPAGTKDLTLPFETDETTIDGVKYNRLTLTFFAAPKKAGKVEVPAASVVAALRVGRQDFFGNSATRLYRAADVARSLEVKPLPETDRPATFAGAVGEQFSIEVRTSRSVVDLGEPVELAVKVTSEQRLDTLSLGKLDGSGRLPNDKFTVAAEPPTGELSADGKTKTFKVVAQVTGPATEIPALAFAYFDPKQAIYRTISSEPIALSVKGGRVVGASDVIVGNQATKQPSAPAVDDTSSVNADLALSSVAAVDDTPLDGTALWVLIAALYALPLAVFGFRSWQLRTAVAREDAGEARAARKNVELLLDRANEAPARELAGPLVAALRDLARALDRPVDDRGLLARIETESFAPEASGKPLSPDLRSDAAGLLRRWTSEARGRGAKSAAIVSIVFALLALAPDAAANTTSQGRAAYQYAMEQTGDPTARKAAFSRAAVALGDAARENPDHPELIVDWGNAAVGAGDVATATLAYRRALAIDPGNARARHVLAWLRGKLPTEFKPIASAGATDTLLFFHRWPRARRLLVGSAAFAIAVLLWVPWRGRRRRRYAVLAIIPLAVWCGMLASIVVEDDHRDDAVVMDGVALRAADSVGAPAAWPQPIPRGAEVRILERRDAWARIEIANATSGWVPAGAVERIAP